jgi:two-component system NtrC family sensor kinase
MALLVMIGAAFLAAEIGIARPGRKPFASEKAAAYALTIEQARRHAGHFLIYGTGRRAALSCLDQAQGALRALRDDLIGVIGPTAFRRTAAHLDHYRDLVMRSGERPGAGDRGATGENAVVPVEWRQAGAQAAADATDAADRLRLGFHRRLEAVHRTAAGTAVLLALLAFGILAVVVRDLVKPGRPRGKDAAAETIRRPPDMQARDHQLMESRKMAAIGTLTAGIAHEINNPLNNISLTAETLIDDFGDLSDAEKLDLLKELFGQVERAGATVANLLDFTHRDRRAFKPLDINDVLQAAVGLVQSDLRRSNITVEMALGKALPAVNGHHPNLQQVFLNLFLNAQEAMPDGGTLTIASRRDGAFVDIAIGDTGHGISEEHLHRVFDPFFTTKEVGKGTGLGLSVSFGIIARHHGTITVKSAAGQGTVFAIRLPVLPPADRSGGMP